MLWAVLLTLNVWNQFLNHTDSVFFEDFPADRQIQSTQRMQTTFTLITEAKSQRVQMF